MAGRPLDGHKRSRSSLALSILNREKSKSDVRSDDPSVNAETVSSTGSVLSRHKSRLSVTDIDAQPPDVTVESPSSPGASPVVDRGLAIEQSVRVFRLFEALRSGDTTAISKAIRDSSVDDEGRKSTSDSIGAGSTSAVEGTTVLHLAIQCADLPVVEYVLSSTNGATGTVDVNARDKDGNTPLHLAAMLGRAPIVRLLLQNEDIDDSVANFQGRQPLDLARTPDIYQELQLARSMFLESTVKEIQELVVQRDYESLAKLLEEPRIQKVLDVNGAELSTDPMTTQLGGTLLHEAARKKDLQLIQLLLLHGADPFRRDRNGKLPQDVTKDDKTRAVLKKSPAAAAAQRGIQEKAVLGSAQTQASTTTGSASAGDNALVSKDAREMKGYLKKWTNYTGGYKLRWFVLEDGVLSYYKHQDDAGSACRGAINMRIAALHMDAQDKAKFEIHGKSSVKYHLKANHVVEAKRWVWALNNAIQWAKDEARAEEKRNKREEEMLRQAKIEKTQSNTSGSKEVESINERPSGLARRGSRSSKGLGPGTPASIPAVISRPATSSVNGDDDAAGYGSYEPSLTATDAGKPPEQGLHLTLDGDGDDDEDFGDDASSHELQQPSRDAFNITAQSARLQVDMLSQLSAALQAERSKSPDTSLSDRNITQALSSFDAAVRSLKSLIGDLSKISRDRDAYWQYRLDREIDVRRLLEDSMTRLAREQDILEGKVGEAEDKRRKTKKALREILEASGAGLGNEHLLSTGNGSENRVSVDTVETKDMTAETLMPESLSRTRPRKPTLADLQALSDSDSEDEDEFFDAIDAGDVEVVEELPHVASTPTPKEEQISFVDDRREQKRMELISSFRGYEEPIRTRLRMDKDDRPKISLWGILKSMIGKDMTKMTLPVSFNEPTSLLQRVAEDMEYTDLLDTAADRVDSTERMVYVAAFAASEYASTIGRVAKPFNPLLGETYEYARPDKGYRFFIEQVSHHPPIGAAYAESPKWDYYGESAVKSKFYGKSFDINPLGTWFLRLRPTSGLEELYTWKKVTSSVVGIISGNPTVDNYGVMEIKNWTTGETATLDFKPRGWKASSAYQVSGKVVDADGKTRWSIGGRWNDKIYARLTPGFEGAVEPAPAPRGGSPGSSQAFLVWQAHERPQDIPFNLTPFVLTLNDLKDSLRPYLAPTDTRLRPDQRAMEDGAYDFAATEKNRLEEKQRAKRRDREMKGEIFVPKWFSKGRCATTGEEYWVFNGRYWNQRTKVVEGSGTWEGVEDIF